MCVYERLGIILHIINRKYFLKLIFSVLLFLNVPKICQKFCFAYGLFILNEIFIVWENQFYLHQSIKHWKWKYVFGS